MKKTLSLLVLIVVCIYGVDAQHVSQSSTLYDGNIYHLGGNFGFKTTTPRTTTEISHSIGNPTPLSSTVGSGGLIIGDGSNVGMVMGTYSSVNGYYPSYIQARNLIANNLAYNLILQPLGGNVGVGTITPNQNLVVNRSLTNTHWDAICIANSGSWSTTPGKHSNLIFTDATQTSHTVAAIGATYENGLGRIDFHSFYNNAYNTDNQITMSVNVNGVGVGTTNPLSALHLSNNNHSIVIRMGSVNNNLYESAIRSRFVDNVGSFLEFGNYGGSSAFNNFLSIAPTGNIGIGTTNPIGYKLAVEGTIGAREVKVTTAAWADFVFLPTYKLRTLGEVEQFIKTNNHLPEIPTEAEVKENGVGLGEMNAKLLQKIEELTLYMIEMKKENELQNREIKELKEIIQNNK